MGKREVIAENYYHIENGGTKLNFVQETGDDEKVSSFYIELEATHFTCNTGGGYFYLWDSFSPGRDISVGIQNVDRLISLFEQATQRIKDIQDVHQPYEDSYEKEVIFEDYYHIENGGVTIKLVKDVDGDENISSFRIEISSDHFGFITGIGYHYLGDYFTYGQDLFDSSFNNIEEIITGLKETRKEMVTVQNKLKKEA